MTYNSPFFHPARLISYDQDARTAQVAIDGLTDGLSDGITAMLAYPIGDDDLDTERELISGADVWVFFEQGKIDMPVVAFYRRHGQGRAVIDVRRIRQKNIELLARANMTLSAEDFMHIKAKTINIDADTLNITAETNVKGDINQVGNYFITGDHTVNGSQTVNGNSTSYGNQMTYGQITVSVDVIAGGISQVGHTHGGTEPGSGSTSTPNKYR
ncbi:phage baseplate assembly protein [Psychrobacter aestuarii]|uniref:Phage protein Gp138 N-terminal domain-containing protein n=1 Tax=Psychrobacter aestuarii TaxID=556327 RepID=A0ABN0VXB9_9GAMM|nr:phage baseplate assembly protein [Psychrobacter aestuarii]